MTSRICPIAILFFSTALGSVGQAGPLVPRDVSHGSRYQLAFVTDETHDAVSTDISAYNSFVRQEAAVSPVRTGTSIDEGGVISGTRWLAIASTPTQDARDNAMQIWPVYNLQGQLIDRDPWDGRLETQVDVDQFARFVSPDVVYTGSEIDGTRDQGRELGQSKVRLGRTNSNGNEWITGEDDSSGLTQPLTDFSFEKHRFYALSETLIAPIEVVLDLTISDCIGTPTVCNGLSDSGKVEIKFDANAWEFIALNPSPLGESASFAGMDDAINITIPHATLPDLLAASIPSTVQYVADNRTATVDFFSTTSQVADSGAGTPVNGGMIRLTVNGNDVSESYVPTGSIVPNLSDKTDVAFAIFSLYVELAGGSVGFENVAPPLGTVGGALGQLADSSVDVELSVFGSFGQATILGTIVPIPIPEPASAVLVAVAVLFTMAGRHRG